MIRPLNATWCKSYTQITVYKSCVYTVCDYWPLVQSPGGPTQCWGVCGCVGVPLRPGCGPARPPQPHWDSWGWDTFSLQPWSLSPMGNFTQTKITCTKKHILKKWFKNSLQQFTTAFQTHFHYIKYTQRLKFVLKAYHIPFPRLKLTWEAVFICFSIKIPKTETWCWIVI